MYYDNLKNLITSGTQTLRTLEGRIAWQHSKGYITGEEADELLALAQSQAAPPDVPENTEMAVRLGTLEATVALLVARVAVLEAGASTDPGDGEDGGETPAGPPDGVEQWSAAKAYMYGDTVWKDGQTWVSQEGNNRFEPGVQDWAWKAVGV